jgi:hypothetical protein
MQDLDSFQLEDMTDDVDPNGTGTITFLVFLRSVARRMHTEDSEVSARAQNTSVIVQAHSMISTPHAAATASVIISTATAHAAAAATA